MTLAKQNMLYVKDQYLILMLWEKKMTITTLHFTGTVQYTIEKQIVLFSNLPYENNIIICTLD